MTTALQMQVLGAVRTIGRGARVQEIATVAGCRVGEATDALCGLEADGLVAVWSWAPVHEPEATR